VSVFEFREQELDPMGELGRLGVDHRVDVPRGWKEPVVELAKADLTGDVAG
jgi:hypothetical protein